MNTTHSDVRCRRMNCDLPERHFIHGAQPWDAERAKQFGDLPLHDFVAPAARPEEQERKQNINAQEEVVCALWDFARALGIPKNPDTTRPIMDACGPALQRIMSAFNCRVTEIQ